MIVGKAIYTGNVDLARGDPAPRVRPLAVGARRVLTRRIIPCLDVNRGRVVKGVTFEQLRDAGDPVELAELLQPRGRRRAGLLRHHGLGRGPRRRSSTWCSAPPTRSSSRSRSAAASAPPRTSGRCCGPAPTKSRSTRAAVARPGADPRGVRLVRQPVHRAVDGRASGTARSTRSSPTAGAARPAWTLSSGRSAASSLAPARSSSTASTPTAPRTATRSS